MWVYVGWNKQGALSFLSVICAAFATPYLVSEYAPDNPAKAQLFYFAVPFMGSFVVMHIAEMRSEVAKWIINKIKKG